MKNFLTALAAFAFFALSAVETVPYKDASGKQVRYAGKFDTKPVQVPVKYQPKASEWRGVWVATVENIDLPAFNNADEFRAEYRKILDNLQSINANAVLFQIRPTNDAFYPSKLNPWSRFLSGKEGKSLGQFDPLKFMVEETHKRGMEFHAWLNPYRVIGKTAMTKEAYLNTLDPLNFARRNPNMILEIPQGDKRMLIMDPGQPKVKEFIVNTVAEIVNNYDVDAIHFDDYFYPYSGLTNQDAKTFQNFNSKKLGLEDWRRSNVDDIILGIKTGLSQVNRTQNRRVQLGISPFGIWANQRSEARGSLTGGKQAYSELYADLHKWIKNGWIDYVIPQLYWHFDHDVAAYAVLVDWWSNVAKGTTCNLYIGHSVGRLGSTHDKNELGAQLRYDSANPVIQGECLFSYKSVFKPSNDAMRTGGNETLKKYWQRPAALPKCPRN